MYFGFGILGMDILTAFSSRTDDLYNIINSQDLPCFEASRITLSHAGDQRIVTLFLASPLKIY